MTAAPTDNGLDADRHAWRELKQAAQHLLVDHVTPHERMAVLRAQANERGFAVRDQELMQLFAEARRRLQGKGLGASPGDEFDIPEEVWAWDQLIAAATPNLLVALQKVGKTALCAGLISAWHYGTGSWLGHTFSGPCPPVIIAGTDQTMADWRSALAPAGLMTRNEAGRWKLAGPIVRLWHRGDPIYLDLPGIEAIADACQQHPGALLICDTYAALTAPLGLDEAKPEAAEPLYNLMELVEPSRATPILLHHASKSRANERASNASRNTNAIPAAVSQIISLQWLEPDRKSDQRIHLTTEGRNSKPVDLVIEQVDRSQWVSHGSAQHLKEQRHLQKVEDNLTERQSQSLAAVRDAWQQQREMAATDLVDLLPHEFDGKDARRSAFKTLEQLYTKKLLDKRNHNDPAAGGTVIRFRPANHLTLARGGM